jgi:galactitol-specific phosphotransferase system IIB component
MSLPVNINTGFRETLYQNPNSSNKITPLTEDDKKNVCKDIFITGKKINNKYSIPSQFPVITSNTQSNKKIGGRKKRRKTLRKRRSKYSRY